MLIYQVFIEDEIICEKQAVRPYVRPTLGRYDQSMANGFNKLQ